MRSTSGVAGRSARAVGAGERRTRARRGAAAVAAGAAAVAAGVAVLAAAGRGRALPVGPPVSGEDAVALVGAGVLTAAAATWWWVAPRRDPGRWARGAAGEEATAALLAGLPRGWAVLHDRRLPGSRANVDHLVIGRRRAWVVDSKAYRGRLRAGWRGPRAAGHPIEVAPAAWEAEVVAERLGVDVAPLVVVHGEGLRRRRRVDGVPVVPAHRLVGELRAADRGWGRRRRRREVRDLAAVAERRLPAA
jgi:hypothetical protein